jgi:L-fuconolactonase
MIIDSHQHFWNYDPVKDSWIDESMGVLKKDFLPKDLAPILKENGVDSCIAVQADQSEKETEFLLSCAAIQLSTPFSFKIGAKSLGRKSFFRTPILSSIQLSLTGS